MAPRIYLWRLNHIFLEAICVRSWRKVVCFEVSILSTKKPSRKILREKRTQVRRPTRTQDSSPSFFWYARLRTKANAALNILIEKKRRNPTFLQTSSAFVPSPVRSAESRVIEELWESRYRPHPLSQRTCTEFWLPALCQDPHNIQEGG